jgi:VanZ family protein
MNYKNKKKLNTLFNWLPVVFWAFVIFFFSAQPTQRASRIYWEDFIIKKSAHIIEYFVLSLLLFRALISQKIEKTKSLKISALVSVIYAITDEFHQSFVPGRDATVRDVLIDSFGVFLAVYFILRVLPKLPEGYKTIAVKLGILEKKT